MKTIKFRVRNPMKWLSPLISTVYLIGVVILCIQNFRYLLLLTGGSRFLFLLVLAPVLAPLCLLLWLLDPARQVHMGEGRLVLTQGDDVLGQISYPEIAHMRLTGRHHHLDVFDRAGVNRIHVEPAVFWREGRGEAVTVAIVDFMRTQLPHLENRVEQGRGQKAYVERYIDFPPQTAQGPQQTIWQQPPAQPWQQPTHQQPQGQSGWR